MERQRITRQRQVILEELKQAHTHATAAEIYELVRKRLPRISLGTVYRNLERLLQDGLVRKMESSSREARFDADLTDHHHIRCLNCGRIDDFHHPPAINVGRPPAESEGWRIDDHRIEFVGLCPDCRAA